MDKIYTHEQVQEILGVSRNTLGALLRSGQIGGFKIGQQWRIPESALRDFISRKMDRRRAAVAADVPGSR